MGCIFSERSHSVDIYRRVSKSNKVHQDTTRWIASVLWKVSWKQAQHDIAARRLWSSSCQVSILFLRSRKYYIAAMACSKARFEPIENVWAMLKRELGHNSTYPTSKNSLFNGLSEVWDSLPTYFEKLIASMTSRVKEVQTVKGL